MSVEEGELQNIIEGYDIDNGGTIDKHEFADLVAVVAVGLCGSLGGCVTLLGIVVVHTA